VRSNRGGTRRAAKGGDGGSKEVKDHGPLDVLTMLAGCADGSQAAVFSCQRADDQLFRSG
jgi:hypothetical protein